MYEGQYGKIFYFECKTRLSKIKSAIIYIEFAKVKVDLNDWILDDANLFIQINEKQFLMSCTFVYLSHKYCYEYSASIYSTILSLFYLFYYLRSIFYYLYSKYKKQLQIRTIPWIFLMHFFFTSLICNLYYKT